MITPKAHKNLIGIDCGKKTGVAVWDVNAQRFSIIKTLDFWSAFEWIVNEFSVKKTGIFVEDPAQNKPVWRRATMKNHEFQKKCQHVGGVKRESLLLIEGLERRGYNVQALRPTKLSYTKMSSQSFKKITNYNKRTSEHGRDAAMLVFKR